MLCLCLAVGVSAPFPVNSALSPDRFLCGVVLNSQANEG
jgi:hypothetical protein